MCVKYVFLNSSSFSIFWEFILVALCIFYIVVMAALDAK